MCKCIECDIPIGHTKSAGSLIHRSRYTLSRTWGPTKHVANKISTNIHSFDLNFLTCVIYIYTNQSLRLQTSWTCIACLVGSDSQDRSDHTIADAWDFERQHNRTQAQLSLGIKYMPEWSVNVGVDLYICK